MRCFFWDIEAGGSPPTDTRLYRITTRLSQRTASPRTPLEGPCGAVADMPASPSSPMEKSGRSGSPTCHSQRSTGQAEVGGRDEGGTREGRGRPIAPSVGALDRRGDNKGLTYRRTVPPPLTVSMSHTFGACRKLCTVAHLALSVLLSQSLAAAIRHTTINSGHCGCSLTQHTSSCRTSARPSPVGVRRRT